MKCHGDTAYNNHMPWTPNGALPAGETVTEEKNKAYQLLGNRTEWGLGPWGKVEMNAASVSCYVFLTTVLFSSEFKMVHFSLGEGLLEKPYWTWCLDLENLEIRLGWRLCRARKEGQLIRLHNYHYLFFLYCCFFFVNSQFLFPGGPLTYLRLLLIQGFCQMKVC